ncbi:ribonuclease E inhibitor RraB [Chryseobacterium timonianum]|uniref:ribonuclease E inhibitor RraB n=1 Tax=Chryseobacterium timonianum TaxID=1805473 RepID=UPI001F4B8AE4|nr:ribonuclease E inhibitor RraB [Chryseobacterium timonianum]
MRHIIYKSAINFFVFAIILSCNQKKDEQVNDSSSVVNYKIVETATPDNGLSTEDLDAQAIKNLEKAGIDKNSKRNIEFYFYCKEEQQAKQLTDHLRYMKYTAEYQISADKKEFVVMGYTTPLEVGALVGWSKGMSQVATKYNCVFDGWQIAVK